MIVDINHTKRYLLNNVVCISHPQIIKKIMSTSKERGVSKRWFNIQGTCD